jgi:phosphoribosylaminoimidazole-succinocarboxamide synthase
MPNGIPDKGRILTAMSLSWFDYISWAPNHLLCSEASDYPEILKPYEKDLAGRSMIVRKAKTIPLECIVRGYLTGSGWKEYQKCGTVGGYKQRSGYQLSEKLDKALFTPSTKAEEGHDENITFEEAQDIVGEEKAQSLADFSLRIYKDAMSHAEKCGIILADTKFEFGEVDGEIILIDEVLTPDSSRFWPKASYVEGTSPVSLDKQFVRDWLDSINFNHQPPAPALPDEVIKKTQDIYAECYQRLTEGESCAPVL